VPVQSSFILLLLKITVQSCRSGQLARRDNLLYTLYYAGAIGLLCVRKNGGKLSVNSTPPERITLRPAAYQHDSTVVMFSLDWFEFGCSVRKILAQ